MTTRPAAPAPLVEGLGFTEGPLWSASGELWVTSISRGLIYAVDGAGRAQVVAEPGGNPSGLCQDADGTVWIAQGGGHSPTRSTRPVRPGLQRLAGPGLVDPMGDRAAQGGIAVLDVPTDRVDGPNDCAIGPDGLVWFTDPIGPAMAAEGPAGRIGSLDPVSGEVRFHAGGIRFPNGMAFTPDGATLYVAETGTARVLRYRYTGTSLEPDGVLGALPAGHSDGIALDVEGRVYVAATDADSVQVLDAGGGLVEAIPFPDGSFPTSVCFGGPDLCTLYVTAARGGRVWTVPRAVAGAPLHWAEASTP